MFIQVLQGKIKNVDAARATMDRWSVECEPGATGHLGGTFGVSETGELIAVVRFESEEAARHNSERPEQAAWWEDMKAQFVEPPQFHDYPKVHLLAEGGSNDAGFVQIVQGHVRHPDRIEGMIAQVDEVLRSTRPDVLGATLGIAPDGHFTETVFFESESAAREGEMVAMPLEAKALMEEFEAPNFIDLRDPWFATR